MSLINGTLGKWSDVFCKKFGLIDCQKNQELSLMALKSISGKQEMEMKSLENKIKLLIEANFFPIGFLYTQYPRQKNHNNSGHHLNGRK